MDGYRVAGRRILIVNDDQNMLHLLKHALEQEGMAVDCTTSKADGFSLGQGQDYDMVIIEEGAQDLGIKLRVAGCKTPFLFTSSHIGIKHVVSMVRSITQYAIA